MNNNEIDILCDMFEKQTFNEEHYSTLIENRNAILMGIPKRNQLRFLKENDEIIQGYLKCIDLNEIVFLKEMMHDYLSVCCSTYTVDLKLDILLSIYNSIFNILNS